jgi:hypothetical protein
LYPATVAERLDKIGIDHRLQEGDQGLSALELRYLVRRRLLDLDDQPGLLEDGGVVRDDRGAGDLIGAIEQMGGLAGIRRDHHRVPLLDQPLHGIGHECDPALAGDDLPRHSDRHIRAAQCLGWRRRGLDDLVHNRNALLGHRR